MQRLLQSGSVRLIQSGDGRLLEDGGIVGGGFPGPFDDAGVHVALGYYTTDDDFYLWETAEWDEGLWPPAAAPLVDVSCNVVSISIGRGHDQPLDRFRAGTATVVLDDPDGLYTPWRGAATPDVHVGVRPGIDLVVWVDVDGETIDRFRGVVDTIDDDWPEKSAADGTPHRVTFHAVDAFADLAAFDGWEGPPVGAGELTGTRLARILDTASFARARDLDAGTTAVQATTMARTALEECGVTVDTERGALFCDRTGTLTFRDRNGIVGDPTYTTVQAIFGDADDPDLPGEICYSAITLASDATKIRNEVGIARVGGSQVTVTDLNSQALYGIRTHKRTDLIHLDDTESADIGNDYLETFAYAANRVEALTVELVALRPWLVTLLYLDVLHMIEVHRRAEGFQVGVALQIQSLAERITPSSWTIELRTFAVVPENVFTAGHWDDPASLWDSGLWGF